MNLASAASPTAITSLFFKNTPLSRIRRHVHPHQPHLSSPPTATWALVTGRRAWSTDDGDYPHQLFPATPKIHRKWYKFCGRAVSLSCGGDLGALTQDAGATVVLLAGAYALVWGFDILTQRDFIDQNLSRKLVHILSGLLFVACWPIFSTSAESRYFAFLVPLANFVRLVTHGLSLATDEGLVKSVTRQGKPEELLRGPLYYVLVLIFCVLVFWRESPTGVISVAMMCGGDGIADIMGRRFGSVKIPYNKQKSFAGSISMFMFGFLISMGMLYYFSFLGYFQMDWTLTVPKVALVSFVATLVESLPTAGGVDDNVSVPLVSMVTAFLCFDGGSLSRSFLQNLKSILA